MMTVASMLVVDDGTCVRTVSRNQSIGEKIIVFLNFENQVW